MTIRPSLKLIFKRLDLIILGHVVFYGAQFANNWVFENILKQDPLPIITDVLQILGCLIVLAGVLSFLYEYYSVTYCLTEDGIERTVGLIGKNTKLIRYKNVQTPTLNQSFIGRLVGIGTLEFSASGTSGVDMYFRNIDDPAYILEEVMKLIQVKDSQGGSD